MMTRAKGAAVLVLLVSAIMFGACSSASVKADRVIKDTFPAEIQGFTLFPIFWDINMIGYVLKNTEQMDFDAKLWDGEMELSGKQSVYSIRFDESQAKGVSGHLPGLQFQSGGESRASFLLEMRGLEIKTLAKPVPLEDPASNGDIGKRHYVKSLLYADTIILKVIQGEKSVSDATVFKAHLEGDYNMSKEGLIAAEKRFIGYRLGEPTERDLNQRPAKKEVHRVCIQQPADQRSIMDSSEEMMRARLTSNLEEMFHNLGCIVLQNPEDAKYLVTTRINRLAEHKSELLVKVFNRRAQESVLSLYWVLVDDDADNVNEFQKSFMELFASRVGDTLDPAARNRVAHIAGQITDVQAEKGKTATAGKKSLDRKPLEMISRAEIAYDDEDWVGAERQLDILLGAYPGFAPARKMMAEVKLKLFEYEDARKHLNRLLDIGAKYQDPAIMGDAQMRIGALHREKGEYEEARYFTDSALKNFINCYGDSHPETARCRQQLGLIQLAIAGRNRDSDLCGKAEQSVLGGVQAAAQYYAPTSRHMLGTYQAAGEFLSLAGKNYEAIDSLVMNLALNKQKDGKDKPGVATADSYYRLGSNLIGLKQYNRAIENLKQGLAIHDANSDRMDSDDPRPAADRIALAIVYTRKKEKGDIEKASEYFKQASGILEKIREIQNPDKRKKFFSDILPAYGAEGFRDLVKSIASMKERGETIYRSFVDLVQNAVNGNWIAGLKDINEAFKAGTDESGKKIYVCRSTDESGSTGAVGITYDGGSTCITDIGEAKERFQTLAYQGVEWGAVESSRLADEAHVAGMDKSGSPVYVCRVSAEKGVRVGKVQVQADGATCAYLSGGSIKSSKEFEVLRDKKQ